MGCFHHKKIYILKIIGYDRIGIKTDKISTGCIIIYSLLYSSFLIVSKNTKIKTFSWPLRILRAPGMVPAVLKGQWPALAPHVDTLHRYTAAAFQSASTDVEEEIIGEKTI